MRSCGEARRSSVSSSVLALGSSSFCAGQILATLFWLPRFRALMSYPAASSRPGWSGILFASGDLQHCMSSTSSPGGDVESTLTTRIMQNRPRQKSCIHVSSVLILLHQSTVSRTSG